MIVDLLPPKDLKVSVFEEKPIVELIKKQVEVVEEAKQEEVPPVVKVEE
jgi:hypothetical protein